MSSTDLSITSTDIQLALSPAILESMVGLSQEVIEPIAQVTFYLSWPWAVPLTLRCCQNLCWQR